ncbi:MAG: sigma-70 family RNA polymerase sigma factor [Pseudomonadota bacterium]
MKLDVERVDRASWSQAELVGALQAGDEQAFETVVRRYGGRLLAATRRLLQNEEDARDSVQEAFLQAFRRIDRFEGHADLGTWLHRIAINQALMKLRARGQRREGPIDELEGEFDRLGSRIEPSLDVRETVDEMLARRQTCTEVMARIAELPEHMRVVLMLRDIEELSTREVAALLDLSEANVKIRLHRARAALKKLLEPLWKAGVP